jgi:uncharacterized OB-fold protein
MEARRKPFEPDRDSEHYWAALAQGALELQHCQDCARWTWPPRLICSGCHGENLVWEKPKGTGEVYSWIVSHRAMGPDIPVPNTVVLVRLDEQADILIPGRLVSTDVELRQGLRVRAAPEAITDDVGRLNWTAD